MRCVIHRDEDALFNCYLCKSAICVECESKLRGRSVCPICLDRIRERTTAQMEAETKNPNYPSALALGLVAAGAAAFAWSQFDVMTGRPLDIVALALGALVAYGVMRGAGDKRGYGLQQIAFITTLAGIIFGHFLILLRTGHASHAPLSGGGSDLVEALYAFPGYLRSFGVFRWLCLAAGTVLAYYLPHPRTAPVP